MWMVVVSVSWRSLLQRRRPDGRRRRRQPRPIGAVRRRRRRLRGSAKRVGAGISGFLYGSSGSGSEGGFWMRWLLAFWFIGLLNGPKSHWFTSYVHMFCPALCLFEPVIARTGQLSWYFYFYLRSLTPNNFRLAGSLFFQTALNLRSFIICGKNWT